MNPRHAKSVDTRIARRNDRIAELEHLTRGGVPAHEAAIRAGWPTVTAAARALWRAHHPLATTLEHEVWVGRKAAA